MYIKIGKKTYGLNPAFITLVKYRAEYGESFLRQFLDNQDDQMRLIRSWERLVYTAIKGQKPDFAVYQKEILANPNAFVGLALSLQNEIMRCDGNIADAGNHAEIAAAAEDFDELKLLALCADMPEYIIENFRVFDLIKLLNHINGNKSTGKKYRKMTQSELAKLYGG